tara:strand:+ start:301 stop:1614 length:1314 start_codon:yes stop_codon:yes gene_type:complete
MSEIAGILNAIGRNLEGVDKRRQEQNKVRNQLVREGFDVAPERVGQGTGNKILAGLFGGTSDPTTRATMSERHPYMQAIAKAQAEKEDRQKSRQLQKEQQDMMKEYYQGQNENAAEANRIREYEVNLNAMEHFGGLLEQTFANVEGHRKHMERMYEQARDNETPEAFDKLLTMLRENEQRINEIADGSIYSWWEPDGFGLNKLQSARRIRDRYNSDVSRQLGELFDIRESLENAVRNWGKNIAGKSDATYQQYLKNLGPEYQTQISEIYSMINENNKRVSSGIVGDPNGLTFEVGKYMTGRHLPHGDDFWSDKNEVMKLHKYKNDGTGLDESAEAVSTLNDSYSDNDSYSEMQTLLGLPSTKEELDQYKASKWKERNPVTDIQKRQFVQGHPMVRPVLTVGNFIENILKPKAQEQIRKRMGHGFSGFVNPKPWRGKE